MGGNGLDLSHQVSPNVPGAHGGTDQLLRRGGRQPLGKTRQHARSRLSRRQVRKNHEKPMGFKRGALGTEKGSKTWLKYER